MPRRLRECPGGLIYHVLNRSVAKIDLFKSVRDHQAFETILRQARDKVPVDVLAYCVMTNHWHLVLRPKEDGDLSNFMKWLTLTHVQRWRVAHHSVGFGPLYQGRFKAFPIEEDPHLLTVLRYVERNPLRAGLVSDAQDWKWGSLHVRRYGTAEEKAILSHWPIDIPTDWLKLVNNPQTEAEEQALQLCIKRSRPYGSSNWQEITAKKLGLQSSLRRSGRPNK